MIKSNILVLKLVLLLLVASLISCHKEPITVPSDKTELISFDSSINETKSLVESVENIASFGVYGFYTTDGINTVTQFDGTEIVRNGDTWKYSPETYWTIGAKYSFLGFYPSDANVTINSRTLNSSGELSNPSFTYSLDDDFKSQQDFMFAQTYCQEVVPSVLMNFSHLLCQVNISVFTKSISQIIKLNSVFFSGMSTSGRYTGYTSSSPGVWTSFAGYSSYQEDFTDTQITSEPFKISNSGNGYLLIPRSYDASALKLTLNCSVSKDDGNTYQTVNIQKAFPTTTWERSKKYNYVAEITVDYDIQFSEPTITSWETEQTTGSIIIK